MKKSMNIVAILIATFCLSIMGAQAQDIYTAVSDGNAELVKEILAENPDLLNQKNQDALTPLNLAAQLGKPEMVSLLLGMGADHSQGDNENSMPIHLAAISGNQECVDLLLDDGVDINVQDDNGNTALLFALMYRQPVMATYLVETGADLDLENNRGWTALQSAAIGGNLEMVKTLVENKANVNKQIESGMTPLHSATSFGHLDIVVYLVEHGAGIDIENNNGEQPLHFAQNPNTYAVAEYLLEKGADVNHKNNFNQTPLHSVSMRGSTNVAQLFLDNGANINAPSLDGRTPLTFAAYSRDPDEMSKFLILNGADVNPDPCKIDKACTCGPTWATPVHVASRHGQLAMTKNLVSNGARVNVFNDEGLTPLHGAVMNGDEEVITYLLDNGAFINVREKNLGSTELHLAVAQGFGDVADILIEHGANLDAEDENGMTALDYAWYYSHRDLAYELLAAGANDENLIEQVNTPDMLAEAVGEGEAKVFFTGHSGWAVKTQNHFLVFDYFCNYWEGKPDDSCFASGYIIPEQIKDENVTVFCTHRHGDHFDRRVFNWQETIPDINYVLCWDAGDVGAEYTMIPVHEEGKVDDMNIYVNHSTDLDGGYLVEVDGLVIFHMGDHSNGEDDLMAEFTDEIDLIAEKDVEIDILFGGIRGCSLGQPEQVKQGLYYTLNTLQPKLFVPMHSGSHTFSYKEFAETAEEDGIKTRMKAVVHKGDRFVYKKRSSELVSAVE